MPNRFVQARKGDIYDPDFPGLDHNGFMSIDDLARFESYQRGVFVESPTKSLWNLESPPLPFSFYFSTSHFPKILTLRCSGYVTTKNQVRRVAKALQEIMNKRERAGMKTCLVVDLKQLRGIDTSIQPLVDFLLDNQRRPWPKLSDTERLQGTQATRAYDYFSLVILLCPRKRVKVRQLLTLLTLYRMSYTCQELRALDVLFAEQNSEVNHLLRKNGIFV